MPNHLLDPLALRKVGKASPLQTEVVVAAAAAADVEAVHEDEATELAWQETL